MEKQIRGRDISAPIEYITLDGTRYKTVYNNQTARLAEDVYERQYGMDVGYAVILSDLSKGKYRAVTALFYAALRAGGTEMTWEDFDARFKLDSVPGILDVIARAVTQSLPDAPEDDANP